MTTCAMVCNTTYSLCCKHGSYGGGCGLLFSNALFVLPRKMLKILYQLCTWSTSVRNAVYIMPVYVDSIKILGAHILYLPFYSLPLFYITQSISKNIKSKQVANCIASYRVNFTIYD